MDMVDGLTKAIQDLKDNPVKQNNVPVINNSEFDRLKEVKFTNVPNMALTVAASLVMFKEKKRRKQDFAVEIQIPRRGNGGIGGL